jgi:hypothetical protein
MTSGEKIGAALAKALKSAAAEWKKGEQAPVMYRTNLRDVPKVDGLKRDDGWVDMQVQFLIDKNPPAPITWLAGPCLSQVRGM